MNNVPLAINILFVVITLLTVFQFYNAAQKSRTVIIVLLSWLLLQGIIGLTGFYQVTDVFPPRFVLLLGPVLVFTILLLLSKSGRRFLDSLDIKKLTLLHTVRIPVEITLYFVFVAKLIPGLMTFEGKNFDIISGITAPVIFLLVFILRKAGNTTLLIWNFVCLGLLLNILTIAILSAQTPFQRLAFDQPNVGVTFFPFIWLPAVIVPLVLIAHLAAIRQLIIAHKKAAQGSSREATVVQHRPAEGPLIIKGS